jgi:anti-sigma B factor antagonist
MIPEPPTTPEPDSARAAEPVVATDTELHLTDTELHLTVSTPRPGVTVLRVAGEVDLVTVPQLRAAVGKQLDAPLLVLDLSELGFLGSVGLEVLVDARDQLAARGGALRLVTGGAVVRRPLELTGLTRLLACYATLVAALE